MINSIVLINLGQYQHVEIVKIEHSEFISIYKSFLCLCCLSFYRLHFCLFAAVFGAYQHLLFFNPGQNRFVKTHGLSLSLHPLLLALFADSLHNLD
jgi:hypothetical protein